MWTLQKKYGPVDPKRVFMLILCVATFSFLLSYQLGQHVIYIDPEEHVSQGRSSLDVVFNGKNFGRSLNMHASNNERLESRPANLFSRLLQVEEKLLERRRRRKIGLVGLSDSSGAEVLKGLQNIWTVLGQTLEPIKEAESGNKEVVIQGNYSMILCVGNSEVCPEIIRSSSGGVQRMNRIMAIEKELSNATKLCKLAKVVQQRAEQYDKRREQPCHNMPDNTLDISDSDRTTYPVVVASYHSGAMTVLYNTTTKPLLESRDRNDIITLWTFSSPPLTYQSGSVVRLEVLVTSYTPLRIYMSPTGTSGPLEALSQPDLFGEQATLEEMLQHVGEKYGISASTHWWNTIQVLLMKTLVSAEMALQNHATSERCLRCFGTYSIVIVCTNIRQCFIMQMKPLLSEIVSRVDLLGHMFQLLTSEKMVVMDVSGALEAAGKHSDLQLCEEQTTSSECLSDDALAYLLIDRRESLEHTDLIKIYPTTSSSIFTPFLNNLKASSQPKDFQFKATHDLHDLLMDLEAYYSRLKASVPDHFDISESCIGTAVLPTDPHVCETEMYGADSDFDYQDTLAPVQGTSKDSGCTTDKAFYKELSNIKTEPAIQFHQYSHDEYRATIEYETILVKVLVTARHCCCEFRFGDLIEPARPTNFTLGLGENIIRLLMVDTTFPEPKVIRTVKLYLYRESHGMLETVSTVVGLRTCYKRQDCSLPFSRSASCGLQGRNISWSQFEAQKKPACDNGDIQGAWAVPCTDCISEESCYWSNAKWQPDTCSYRHLSDESIRKCLEKRNILFIGDSTNRGIMHFLIESTNGSLYSMDKTHTLKTYHDLNKGKTNMAFAYYPHFWLPANHRPTFHKVLYQLIKRSLPLGNNANTVLVVGGVHWLAKRHIDVILAALIRTGLSNITKVVKGLGAGFHQNINGVRFVSKDNQAKLLIREREVLHYAKQQDFKVVGTFNMTMARYKDFTQGKCACHFHKISKRTDTHEQLFKVEGDINAEYSQILLHNICDIS